MLPCSLLLTIQRNFLEQVKNVENRGKKKNKELVKAFQNIYQMTVENNSVLKVYYWVNNENKYKVDLALVKILKNNG